MAQGQKGQLEGSLIGAGIGSLFGGVGAAPGAAAGGLAGKALSHPLGGLFGKKKKPAPPPPWYQKHAGLLILAGVGALGGAVYLVVS